MAENFINKKVKIIKDTVSHRIPINKIVRIKSLAESHRGKICYNVLDMCCYISEDDFVLVDQDTSIEYITIATSNTDLNELDDALLRFDSNNNKGTEIKKTNNFVYAKNVVNGTEIKKPYNFVYAKNVMSLDPSGKHKKAPSGKYLITGNDKLRYWLRNIDVKDINEYYCLFQDAELLKV